jgi:hypothetical protein
MSSFNQVRFTARIVAFCVACAALPFAAANPNGRATVAQQTCGSAGNPVEVLLPFEMQVSYLHSLPTAGLLVTPDAVAQRVLMDPRLRATTSLPTTGKGVVYPIKRSGFAVKRSDEYL